MFNEGTIYISGDEYIEYLEIFDLQKPKIITEGFNEIIHEFRTKAFDVPGYDFVLRELFKPWMINGQLDFVTEDIDLYFENSKGEKIIADLEIDPDEDYIEYDSEDEDLDVTDYDFFESEHFYNFEDSYDEGDSL